MCLLTGIAWAILLGIVILLSVAKADDKVVAIASLVAVGLGILMPIIMSYWKPLFFRWSKKRKALQNALQAQGVLEQADLEHGARAVQVVEVDPETEKPLRKTKQAAFLVMDQKTLRILGASWCVASDAFTIRRRCTGQCSKCLVIWACGGEPFAVRMQVDDKPRMFQVWVQEGRTLREAARFGEMLEEHLLGEAPPETAEAPAESGDEPDPEKDLEPTATES